MITVEVTRQGLDPNKIKQILELQLVDTRNALGFLANSTRDHFHQVIKAKTYRQPSTGTLAKAINVYELNDLGPNRIGFGVGDKDELNYTAPYWYIINYGGYIPAALSGRILWGNFNGQPPDSRYSGSNPGAGTETFYKNQLPLYPMRPVNPIGAKNYIEDTANWASTVFSIQFANGKVSLSRSAV